MNAKERQLLEEATAGAEPRLCMQSRARIDAGRWFRRTPVWLCVTKAELIVLAIARRRYLAQIPLAECAESFYNHATGELVIAPYEELEVNNLPLSPRQALEILPLLKKAPATPTNSQPKPEPTV